MQENFNKNQNIFNLNEAQLLSTAKFRNNIAYYILFTISFLQIIIGIFAIIITQYYEINLTKYFYNLERNQLEDELFFMKLFGIQLIITFIIGLILSKKLITDSYTIHFGLLLTMWHIYNYLLIIYCALMYLMLYRAIDPILNLAETSLLDGISEYSTDCEWRLIWDTMQINRQCCGANNYLDWQKILTRINVDDDNDETGSGDSDDITNSFANITSTPYSCCKLGGYCFNSDNTESLSQDNNNNNNNNILDLPIVNINGINTRGCLDIFQDDLNKFITIVFIILGATIVLQCLILFIMRQLYVKMKYYSLCNNGSDDLNNSNPAIVVVKCPRHVKCVTIPTDDGYEEDEYNFNPIPKTSSDSCRNYCCASRSQLVLH